MAVGLGAAGIVGIGFEALATPGTYVAPTKYLPIENETIQFDQPITKRRPIQGVVDPVGSVLGDGSVSGDITLAAYHDIIPYFQYASRATVTKSGAGPFTYAGVASHIAEPNYTLSITIERNGIVFGYAGCAVASQSWSIDDGILMVTYSIVGYDEAVQAGPTATYDSTGNEFQSGNYTVEYADVSVDTVTDLSIEIDDSGVAEARITGTSGADIILWGERTTTVSLSRDFEARTEYDLFRAATSQKFELIVTDGTHSLDFLVPVLVAGSYEIQLSGQGEVVRGSVEYEGDYDSVTGSGYTLTTITDEDITVPV